MSYLVLARKHRPKTFADVVGQPHVIRPLSNALKSGRIAHAYLFTGARGVGKTTAARLLAMALNCQSKDGAPPCGKCESCLEISDGQAVDVFEVDGASNRGINEIRDLRETIKYLPSKSLYKVYIIDEVHMLTKEAFNALLKTLEEPPAHVVFIFATTEAHKVLATILSRCQRYDFKRINLEDIVGRLRWIADHENIEISDLALRLIARESEGSLRDSLSLFDQVIAFSGLKIRDEDIAEALGLIDQTMISGLARALLGGDAGTALDVLDRVYNFGYDTKDFAAQMLDYFRALVVVKVSRNPEKILDMLDAELAEIRKTAEDASLETVNFHFNAWLDVQTRLHRSNQPRMVLEALIVKLTQIKPLLPLAEIAARLEALLGSVSGSSEGSGGTGGGHGFVSEGGKAGDGLLFAGGSGREADAYRPFAGTDSGAPGVGNEQAPVPAGPAAVASSGRPENEPPDAAAPDSGAYDDDDDELTDEMPDEMPETAVKAQPPTWSAFAERVKSESPLLLSFLDQAEVRQFGRDKVVLVFGQKGTASLIDQPELLERLAVFFGKRPELLVTVEEGASVRNTAADQAQAREQAREAILGNPVVKEATRLFSGEFVDFIPEHLEK